MKKIFCFKKQYKNNSILLSFLCLLSSKASKYTLQSKENISKGFDVYIIKYNDLNHNIGK